MKQFTHDAPFVGVVLSEPVHAVDDEIPGAEISKYEIHKSDEIVNISTATRYKAVCAKSLQEFANVTLACEDNQLNARKSILKAPSMILETENLKIQNSECSNALSLDPHETKKAVLIKTTGKENCEDSEKMRTFLKMYSSK